MQLREEGVRAVEIDPALVRSLGRSPATVSPGPAVPISPVVTAGPERWALAVREDGPAGRLVWRICADGASYEGEAGSLLRSILGAAGFVLAGEPSAQVPTEGFVLTLAFGRRAFLAASANSRALFDRQRGQLLEVAAGKLLGTYAPPDLLPNNVPLKKVVWGDIKTAMAAFSLLSR